MTNHNLQELPQIIAVNRDISWADFICTPVIDFDADGKALSAVRRCAITASHRTIVVRLPHRTTLDNGEPWPPKAVVDVMIEAVGPTVSV